MKRREFLKIVGISTAATAAVAACTSKKGILSNESGSSEPQGDMTYREAPDGSPVSLLGYGMMRLPMLVGDGTNQEINQDMVNQEVDYAIAHGINYFDSSPAYVQGKSEQSLSIALSKYDRSQYNVATKLSNFSDRTKEGSIKMYKDSFVNLGVDVIDFYLLHGIGSIADFEGRFHENGMVEYLMNEKSLGHIRNLGFSIHSDKETFDYMMGIHDSGEAHWDFVQIQMNYVDWNHASEHGFRSVAASYMYDELVRRGIRIVIMEPLLGGSLASVNEHIDYELKRREPEQSVASWAFRFCGTQEGIMTVLSGMTYMEHLIDNTKTFSPLKPLSKEELDLLEKIATQYVKYNLIPCTGCSYCMPCPYGLDIPAIFAHYNKCINEGNMVEDPEDDDYKRARRAFLIGYDRSVPKLRQASHCVHCRECVSHCPQHIGIPGQMTMIDNYVEALKRNK